MMTEELKFCPHCGSPVTVDDVKCPQCQTDLSVFRSDAPAPKKLNLNALYSNPYREGMKRVHDRQGNKPAKHRWRWPWSKESR